MNNACSSSASNAPHRLGECAAPDLARPTPGSHTPPLHGLPARLTVAASLALTLVQISTIETSWLLALMLPVQWALVFRPIARREWALFALVAPFFVVQNYVALRAGAFAFRQQDFLLMPWHEPVLWMGWYLHLVRLVGEPAQAVRLHWTAGVGLLATVIAFSAFGGSEQALNIAVSASSAVLLALFHRAGDLAWGACAVALGLLVEWAGVTQGLWFYPGLEPAAIPFWSGPMWLSVGLLGRRLVVPLAEWLVQQAGGRDA